MEKALDQSREPVANFDQILLQFLVDPVEPSPLRTAPGKLRLRQDRIQIGTAGVNIRRGLFKSIKLLKETLQAAPDRNRIVGFLHLLISADSRFQTFG